MRNSIDAALHLFWHIRHEVDFDPVLDFATRSSHATTKDQAADALDAVLQILAAHAKSRWQSVPFAMAAGEVYSMYRALRMYHGDEFDAWCMQYFGTAHNIILLGELAGTQPEMTLGLDYTIGQLEACFTVDISRHLYDWAEQHKVHRLRPCALLWSGEPELLSSRESLVTISERWVVYTT